MAGEPVWLLACRRSWNQVHRPSAQVCCPLRIETPEHCIDGSGRAAAFGWASWAEPGSERSGSGHHRGEDRYRKADEQRPQPAETRPGQQTFHRGPVGHLAGQGEQQAGERPGSG